MKSILITAALIAVTTFASPSQAQPAGNRAAAVVSTAGLDLSTPAGQRVLDLRVLHAASALCGIPSSTDPLGRSAFNRCRAEARASAAVELARRTGAVEVASRR
jgi:UrcA family protein